MATAIVAAVLASGAVVAGAGGLQPAAAADLPPATSTLPTLAPRMADSLNDTYGVVAHIAGTDSHYGDTARVAAALRALGARHIRSSLYDNIPAQWAAFNTLAAQGIRADLMVGNPRSADTPRQMIDVMADRLDPGVVETVEGANEWNLSGDPNWVSSVRAYQSALYNAVKANPATAGLPVLAPSLGVQGGWSDLGDLSSMADIGNLHIYPGGRTPSTGIEQYTDQARINVPGKPVIFTESGYHNAMNTAATHYPTPEGVAGTYTPRLLLEHFARGTKRVYSYQLLDETADPALVDPEANFGLLREDWTPKPAYTAMSNLLRLTADPGPAFPLGRLDYQVTGATDDVRQILLQKRDGSFQLVLWRDVSVYDRKLEQLLPVTPVPVQVNLGAIADVTVSDPSRSAVPTEVDTATSQLTLPLSGNAVVLSIQPAPAPPSQAAGAAAGLPALARDRGAVVRWDAPTAGGNVSGYTVTASPGGATVTAAPVARTVLVGGLTNGTPYTFTIRATGDGGNGPASAPTPVVVPNAPAGAVRGVSALPRDRAAQVSWTTPGGGPVSSYTITPSRGVAPVTVPAGTTTARVQGLVNGQWYRFTVTANGPGGSGPVSALTASVQPMPVPGAARSVRAVPGSHTAQVSWAAPAGGGPVRQYLVQASPGGFTHIVGSAVRTTRFTGLTNGTAYTFRVTPIGSTGNGATVAAFPVVPHA